MRLLVTGARAPATLELVRLASRAGHEVHVADSVRLHLCRWSRHAAARHLLPAPARDRERFAAALARVVDRHRIERVIPTCEEVFHLAAVQARIPAPVFAEPLERLAAWHDKGRFVETARALGLAVPESRRLTSARELEGVPSTGWVLKPVFSRFATRTRVVPAGAPLPAVSPSARDPWLLQRLVPGALWCSWSVAHAGRLSAHAVYRVEATAGALGAAVAFTGEHHEAIDRWVERFVAGTGATGQLAFDFVVGDDGPVALECNPRLTSGLHLFRDDPAVSEAFVRPIPLRRAPAGERFGSALALRYYGHPALDCRDLTHDADDPWPHRLQGLVFADLLVRALVRRRDPRALSTEDIEWNGS